LPGAAEISPEMAIATVWPEIFSEVETGGISTAKSALSASAVMAIRIG